LRETRVNRAHLFPAAQAPGPAVAGPAQGPLVYRGAEAVKQSAFPVPEISVRHVEKGVGDVPGWTIEVRNRLGEAFPADTEGVFPPDFTNAALRGRPIAGQPMGLVTTLRLGDEGQDKANMYPKLLAGEGAVRRWFLHEGAQAQGPQGPVAAEAGAPLTVGTRGMGIYARIALPAAGQEVTVSPEKPELYSLRPDQVEPANLSRAFAHGLKAVQDPP
jgi:hypothetical protein